MRRTLPCYRKEQSLCDLTYQLADNSQLYHGFCVGLTAGELSFTCQQAVLPGLALRVHTENQHPQIPALTAFVETTRCIKQSDDCYTITAAIQSIQGH